MTRAAPDDPTARAGPMGAPAIVFLHGTRLTRSAWAAQIDASSDEFRTIAIDLPGHGTRAGEAFTLEGAADLVAADDPGPRVRRSRRRRRAVARRVRGDGPRGARSRTASAASSWPARRPNRSASGRCAYRGLAGAMDRFDGPGLERLNAWFFRRRYPSAIAEPIVAGGFWSAGGAHALPEPVRPAVRAIAWRPTPVRP